MPQTFSVLDADWLHEHTEVVDISTLRPHPENPNIGDVDKVAKSLKKHGQFRAIGISVDDVVLFGNHTYMGAMQEGKTRILVHRLPWRHDTAKARAVMLADNKARDGAETNETELAEVLRRIEEEDEELLAATLFEDRELAELKRRLNAEEKDLDEQLKTNPDDAPAPPKDPITRPLDVWQMGDNRLICGDSTDPATWSALLKGESADFIFTSPPYNVDVNYGEHKDGGEWEEYRSFLSVILAACHAHLEQGRAICWNIGVSPKTYHGRQLVLMEEIGFTYWRQIVWDKVVSGFPLWDATTKPVARSFNPNYRHEVIYVMSKGGLLKGSEVDYGRDLRDDVFAFNPAGVIRDIPDGDQRIGSQTLSSRSAKAHPAAFPVALPEAFINHLADVGGIVLDPFCGSGSTILAAMRTGRRGFGIELDPAYCDVALRRYQEQTGELPLRLNDGEYVDFIERPIAA